MTANSKTVILVATATATQTLPEEAVAVLSAVAPPAANTTSGVITSSGDLTPTTGTPSASEIQFTGSPHSPSNQVTLSAAPTAGQLLAVTYVPLGAPGAAV